MLLFLAGWIRADFIGSLFAAAILLGPVAFEDLLGGFKFTVFDGVISDPSFLSKVIK